MLRYRDAALAAALCVVSLAGLFAARPGDPPWPVAAIAVVVTGALAVRRRWPLLVLLVNAAGIIAFDAMDYPSEPPLLGMLVALYTVAVTGGRRRTLVIGGALAAVAAVVILLTDPADPVPILLDAFVLIVTAATLGEAVRVHRAYRAEVAEREARAEYAREQEARRRVAEERVRIARDLHDVLAHSIAQINVQAGVAAHLLHASSGVAASGPATSGVAAPGLAAPGVAAPGLATSGQAAPDPGTLAAVAATLESIAETSRVGMAELASALDVLRTGEPDGPVPDLGRVRELVESVAGVETELEVVGDVAALPPALQVAAYRIVQESLTNVVRHAGARRAAVSLVRDADGLCVTVADDGARRPGSDDGARRPGSDDGAGRSGSAAGYGILGMTERAQSVGGTLTAGPEPGGFTVEARLPYRAVAG